MLSDNKKYNEFVGRLRQYGVDVRYSWTIKKSAKHSPNDLHFVLFYGRGFSPEVLCAIVVDYESGSRTKNGTLGFGLFVDGGDKLDDDVLKIVGKAGIAWKERQDEGHAASARAMSEEMCGPL